MEIKNQKSKIKNNDGAMPHTPINSKSAIRPDVTSAGWSLTGFTLLELLLGISLFCIIAVAIYSSMALGIKVHKRGGTLTGRYNDIRFAFERIEQDVRSAMQINSIYFIGEPQKMYFYSIQMFSGGQKELSKITYSTERENNYISLFRAKETYSDSMQSTHPEGDNLLDSISKLDFDYGYLKKEATGGQILQWKEEWKEEGAPKLVRISLDVKGEKFNDIVYCPAGKMGQEKEQ